MDIGQFHIGLADDGDRLPGAIDVGEVERRDVVDGGEIGGRHMVGAAAGHVGMGRFQARLEVKIAQSADAGDDPGERRWNGRIGGIGVMHLAVHEVVVDLGVERSGDLVLSAAESNVQAAAGGAVDGKALRFQPRGDAIQVVGTDAVCVGVLLGREPLVVLGRSRVLLLGQQLAQRGALGGGRFEYQRHALNGKASRHGAAIVFRASLRTDVAAQHHRLPRIDGRRNAAGLRIHARQGKAEGNSREGGSPERYVHRDRSWTRWLSTGRGGKDRGFPARLCMVKGGYARKMLRRVFAFAVFWGCAAWCAPPAFHLRDTQGAVHSPAEWAGHKAVVVLFVTTDCPIANSYVPEMNRMHQDYQARGVLMYAVQAEPRTPEAEVVRYARDYRYSFPLLLDEHQELVKLTGATITPQAAVLSPEGKVLYLGRIDNRAVDFGVQRPHATELDLREALDAVLAGKAPPHAFHQVHRVRYPQVVRRLRRA